MEEFWLTGAMRSVSPMLMPAAHALSQAERDVVSAAAVLSVEALWREPRGVPSVGFHLNHIAGSIDRLLTYCRNERLSEAQNETLANEKIIDTSIDAARLTANAVKNIRRAKDAIVATADESLFEWRYVGRKRLSTNVFGLLFHIAEHTQRHVGQIITTAKIAASGEAIG